jgi:hypothetical protein
MKIEIPLVGKEQPSTMKAKILVHGGADTALRGKAKLGVIRAAKKGMGFSDSALDMV